MVRRLRDLNLNGKRVFVRVDFNVPLRDDTIGETHRIDSTLPTLRWLLERAKKLILASHLGRPGGKPDSRWSLAPVRSYLEKALGQPVALAADCIGAEVERLVNDPAGGKVVLLENLRFHAGEEENSPAFCRALAELADVYVNDAFGAAHRAHASTTGMAKLFHEKAAGLLLEKELDYLGRVLASPEKPFVTLLGGAKVSDKIGVIENLLPRLTTLLIGGGMAYTFLKARGVGVGKSLVENDRVALAQGLMRQAESLGVALSLPVDHVCASEIGLKPITADETVPPGHIGLDIGPRTVRNFCQAIESARTVLWNGPVGLFENPLYRHGTTALARALAQASATSIVAGGDTVAAVRQAGVEDKIAHLSTGGGATLEFLEGKRLPGIEALG